MVKGFGLMYLVVTIPPYVKTEIQVEFEFTVGIS
jgi:hypothetical protein